jgi:hypothetical protein
MAQSKTKEKAKVKVQGKANPKKVHAKTEQGKGLDTGKSKGKL